MLCWRFCQARALRPMWRAGSPPPSPSPARMSQRPPRPRPPPPSPAPCKEEPPAAALARALGSPTFRPYHTTDVRGVEIGGAAKNVLAIAAGIVVGRNLGASAQAALTTRGFSELSRFGRALGARGETLSGLSGLGDLLLTC